MPIANVLLNDCSQRIIPPMSSVTDNKRLYAQWHDIIVTAHKILYHQCYDSVSKLVYPRIECSHPGIELKSLFCSRNAGSPVPITCTRTNPKMTGAAGKTLSACRRWLPWASSRARRQAEAARRCQSACACTGCCPRNGSCQGSPAYTDHVNRIGMLRANLRMDALKFFKKKCSEVSLPLVK